jgi:hypothetical protein
MDEAPNTIKLRYDGSTRFAGAKLPVELLPDLPAFRELLVAFAKETWKRTHVDKSRVPKGFDRSLAFDLTHIEEGSAVPCLRWDRRSAQESIPGFSDEFSDIIFPEVSRIAKLFSDAAKGVFPNALPCECIKHLNKFGAGLRQNERIEFIGQLDEEGKLIYVDSLRRKQLMTNIRSTYEKRIDGTGKLTAVSRKNDEHGQITVQTDNYGTLSIFIEPERVKEFDGHIDEIVQYDIQVTLDSSDIVQGVIEVHDLGLIFEITIEKALRQINSISTLQEGWADGLGRKISEMAVTTANDIVRKTPGLASLYRIYPREDGGILFDFEINGWDLSIEVSESGSLEFYGISIEGDESLSPVAFPAVTRELLENLAQIPRATNV